MSDAAATIAAALMLLLQLSSLTYLCLHDCGLTSCDGLLGHLPSVQTLVLSFNELQGLDGLQPYSCSVCRLASLDVSHNQIATWQAQWLVRCLNLTTLDVSYNQLDDLVHLEQLAR